MPKSTFAMAVSFIVLFASVDMALAAKAKKLSYDEAWKRCQVEVNKIPSDQIGQRSARGGACMKKLGHKI